MPFNLERHTRSLLKHRDAKPSKKLGQNFLIDNIVVNKVVGAADLGFSDTVLEIGPGIGALTKVLAKRVKKVLAIEKDLNMVKILKDLNIINVSIFNEDILKINFSDYKLKGGKYRVVGNLPFYLTAPVIRKFLEDKNPPKDMVLVVQKEVGQRICAKVPKMNLLAVSVQIYAEPEIISYISKKSFWPQPKVDSAIIKLALKNEGFEVDMESFFKIVRAGFSQPRKQLLNNLSKGLKLNKEVVKSWLLKNSIQPTQRAETLNTKDWVSLTKTLES